MRKLCLDDEKIMGWMESLYRRKQVKVRERTSGDMSVVESSWSYTCV